jgi:hypothetical protein
MSADTNGAPFCCEPDPDSTAWHKRKPVPCEKKPCNPPDPNRDPNAVPEDPKREGYYDGSLYECENNPNMYTITNELESTAELSVIGLAADEVIINGEIYEEGQHIFSWPFDPCGIGLPMNGNHSYSFSTILLPGESVTFGGRDNGFGGGITVNWTLCELG